MKAQPENNNDIKTNFVHHHFMESDGETITEFNNSNVTAGFFETMQEI